MILSDNQVRLTVTRVLEGEEQSWSIAVDIDSIESVEQWEEQWATMCLIVKESVEMSDREQAWNDMPGEAWIKEED